MTLVPGARVGPTAKPGPERYRGFPVVPHHSLGDDREPVSCSPTVVAPSDHSASHRILRVCPGFATLDEHAGRLCGAPKVPSSQSVRVGKELAAFTASGLFVSHRQPLDRLRQTPMADPVRITTVGVPTRDRASSLERCLASFIDGIRRGEGSPDLIVVDDSAREEHREANRGRLASLRGSYPGRLFYAGPGEKERFARTLAAYAGLDGDDVTFGLTNPRGFPIATGASRNLLLLPRPARRCCNWTTTPSAVWRGTGRPAGPRLHVAPRSHGVLVPRGRGAVALRSRRAARPAGRPRATARQGAGRLPGVAAGGRRAGPRPGRLGLLPTVGRPRRGHDGRRRG